MAGYRNHPAMSAPQACTEPNFCAATSPVGVTGKPGRARPGLAGATDGPSSFRPAGGFPIDRSGFGGGAIPCPCRRGPPIAAFASADREIGCATEQFNRVVLGGDGCCEDQRRQR